MTYKMLKVKEGTYEVLKLLKGRDTFDGAINNLIREKITSG